MKYTTAIATVVALVATVFNDTSTASPLQQTVETGDLASNESFSGIQKRDAFTCHGVSPLPLNTLFLLLA